MKKNYYEMNEQIYQRFDQKNAMFFRYLWDKSLNSYQNNFEDEMLKNIKLDKEGYTHFDYAFCKASWTLDSRFPFAFSWEGDTSFQEDWYGYRLREKKYEIRNIVDFTEKVKKVAKFYGASLVGISEANDYWIYKSAAKRSNDQYMGSTPLNLPQGFNRVIVMAIEMDPIGLSTTPALPAGATTGLGYSKMAFTISCLGEFIRNLGYQALQCSNDTALSIPLAIDAGLGALGRNGLLITPEYGANVRICKVFTNVPLATDQPNFPFIEKMTSFCKNCLRCAEACENKAISFSKEPTFVGKTISNNSGIRKYYINPEKCFEYWVENNSDCSKCITVCPFSNIKSHLTSNEFWKKYI
jgi:epoxyqueuosine reductase